MPIKRPDRYEHNNPNEPVVLSADVKGGALATNDLATLLTDFVGKENKLQQGVTKVFVISEGKDYRLINIALIGNIASWELANESLDKFTPKLFISELDEGSGAGEAAVIRNPNGASFFGGYAYNTGTKITGIIRITLPVVYYNRIVSIEGTIKRGNADELIKFTVGGYFSNGSTVNNWFSIEPSQWERQLTDNLNLAVKFGYVTIEGVVYPVIDFGTLATVWSSYTYVQIDKCYVLNGLVNETFLNGYDVSVISVDNITSNRNNTFQLKSGGASSFSDLDGNARDNADLLSELEDLELADTNEASTRLAADNALTTAINNEVTNRQNADLQIIDGASVDYNTLNKIAVKLAAVEAIIADGVSDGDSIVDTVAELLAVFQTYPEGTDIATLLAGKINTTDIVNNLNQVVTGKVLDASQGKVLNDLITALTTTVGNKVDKITGKGLSTEDYTTAEKTKLSGIATAATANAKATNAEQQTGTDNVKFLTALSNAGWWTNIKSIAQTITNTWSFTKGLFGTTTSKNAHIVIGASTSSLASEHKDWGAAYTGSETGAEWKETTGFRKYLKRNSVTDEYVFMGANPALAGVGIAMPLLAADGTITRGPIVDEGFTLDSDIISAITGATYTTNYATITPASSKIFRQGDEYFDTSTKFLYKAVADNAVKRIQ